MNRVLCKSIGLEYILLRPNRILNNNISIKSKSGVWWGMEERVVSKKSNIVSENAFIQVIGADCQGFSPCVMVSSGSSRYLFNCQEGTQRFCTSNKIRLNNLNHVFITRPNDWSKVSGTHGMYLTLETMGCNKLVLHSAQDLADYFKSMNPYLSAVRKMPDYIVDNRIEPRHEDESIIIDSILIEPGAPELNACKTKKFKSNRQEAPTLAYLLKFPDKLGALDPKKCRELEVPFGPLLAKLKSGSDITLGDGKIIKSSDVCGPMSVGKSIMIVDCPSEESIKNLKNAKQIQELQSRRKDSNGQEIEVVVHMGPEDVVDSRDYQGWMDGFADTCKHLILCNANSKGLNFEFSYRQQYLLKLIDSEMFKDLYIPEKKLNYYRSIEGGKFLTGKQSEQKMKEKDLYEDDHDNEEITLIQKSFTEIDKLHKVEHIDRLHLRPHEYLDTPEYFFPIDHRYHRAKLISNFDKQLEELHEKQKKLPKPASHEPEVLFLGTGSAIPQKYRNSSCIVLNFPHNNQRAILDCGEDTYGQLYRYYGPEQIKQFFQELNLIYISHHHIDHHIGLIKLLSERRKFNNQPVLLLAPPTIRDIINYHETHFDSVSGTFKLFSNTTLMSQMSTKQEFLSKFHGFIRDINLVPVDHCPNACAIVLKFAIGHSIMDTFTLCYSGDARPSIDFERVGEDCDILIHEATMDYLSPEEAIYKKHSTSSEAIRMGKHMKAKFTILTHFSQRMTKIPLFNKEFDDYQVGYAFDFMNFRYPSHIGRASMMKPILETVFKDELENMELRHEKLRNKQRLLRDELNEAI